MKRITVCAAALGFAAAIGCTSSSETADRNKLTAHVGKYDPPPSDLTRVKVGVPPFKVTDQVSKENFRKEELQRDAADQLTTLADKTDRFRLIERAQLEQLLKEQGLEGVVDPEELAKPGRVKGVDYLFIGKVTNMRVKAEKKASGFDLGSLGFGGAFSINDKKSTITVECGVDLRLVEPSSGEVLAADFGEYKRTDSIGATGVRVLGVGGESNADLKIDEDSRGLILRLALDDAVRKMLKKVDKRLLEKQAAQPKLKKCEKCGMELRADATECPSCKAGEGKKCACGEPLAADAKACPKCGAKIGD
ncbi:MAG: hypothetical protein HYY17_01170 [Planctomycetes bacterium]|nr:hypothetical protein [Planctomycetota bacterium]